MVPDTRPNQDACGGAPLIANTGPSPQHYESLHDFLQEMRKHPGLFISCLREQLTITHLWVFTRGYEWAAAAHGIDEFGHGFERGFVRFLREKYRWTEYDHWPALLALHIPEESEAVDRFFELADEYYSLTRNSKGAGINFPSYE
jgi:hypothetical protein